MGVGSDLHGQGFVEVAERCYVARYREWDVNVGLVVGSDAVLVVDTRASEPQGRVALDDVRRIAATKPPSWVVNTHEHFDHVLGNLAFADATIYAHELAAAHMAEAAARIQRVIVADPDLDPDHPEITGEVLQDVVDSRVRLPDRTFSSAATIDLGDRYVELLHPGRGHTDGDLVLRVPDVDLMFVGDLVEESADREATPGFGGDCYPLEWAPTLDLVISMLTPASVVVPGHGRVVNRIFVEQQRGDISDVAEMIRALAAAGVPLDDALEVGSQTSREAPLAQAYGATGGELPNLGAEQPEPSAAAPSGEIGWPFPSHYLGDAVRRGYAQLG
ncbi:MAG: MBL fold metallo-hydrolase [Nocardioidaceae bacterium]